ncbi:porin [Burkholderia aenigmatica]|uniref:Porin n=1 Tax=Burkholderia aenigmatica TaxID=2015348 RepID=A0A228INK6_9BURK|nr:porin [Burkholderia aenigmatica]OXI43980.1 porin [Burkholderia aenigmatica]
MKKSLVVASLLTFGMGAHAQSSVTLYGRIDAGIEYMSGLTNGNGGSTSRWRAESGDWGTSLWGVQGSEDLGGGNKATFHLEGGFNTMNGAMTGGTNQIFNRWATVGLANDRLGTLQLGQQLWITNTGIWGFDPFGETSWSSASLLRGRNWPATSNAISYQSPNLYGLDVYGQYSLSNATNWNGNGTTKQGRQAGLQITYTNPYFQLRGIYDEIRDPANGKFDDVFNYSREYFAGANVFLGQFKVQAVYQASHANGGPAANGGITVAQEIWGGVTWQATPAAALIAAAYHVNANNGGGNATIYSVGGSYNLSKRTLLDLQIATARNSKNANFSLEANAAGPGGPTNDNPMPGHSQTGMYVGLQHMF